MAIITAEDIPAGTLEWVNEFMRDQMNIGTELDRRGKTVYLSGYGALTLTTIASVFDGIAQEIGTNPKLLWAISSGLVSMHYTVVQIMRGAWPHSGVGHMEWQLMLCERLLSRIG